MNFFLFLKLFGLFLAFMGTLLLAIGLAGLIDLNVFAFGLSAGARVVGSLAIMGCLLGALGSFVLEFNDSSS